MKESFRIVLLLILLPISGFQVQSKHLQPSPNKEMIEKAEKRIKKYHTGTENANNVVKVVYFHGNDLEPLNNWNERLTRTLDDVSEFYRKEFTRHGVEIDGVPFEKNNSKYVFHVVKGDSVSRFYRINSGARIVQEIYNKTMGTIDFSRDYVLIINGLCYKRNDGVYVFHSPYGGMGSSINGICQVADCELLDSKLLTDTTHRMKFSEMTVALKECHVAEFNSWYIGGIAHEMGHIFGLPHDFGNPLDLNNSTLSLMGKYGSRHFKDYLWGGEKSAVFSSASILQLISHPVFTQSNKFKFKKPKTNLSDLRFEHDSLGIILKAKINPDELPYAAVTLIHPSNLTEYENRSFSNINFSNEGFSIELGYWPKGNYNLQLLLIYPNGATEKFNKLITINSQEFTEIIQ